MNVRAMVCFGFCIGCGAGPAANTPATPTAPASVNAVPTWLVDNSCPADVMPAKTVEGDYSKCMAGDASCIATCKGGGAVACYGAALHQQAQKHLELSDALFLRACKLGAASGCTNRAASLLASSPNPTPATLRCASATFERSCAAHDPWGCTMFATMLVRGMGTVQDLNRARMVLDDSCIHGDTDPACGAAATLRLQIDKALQEQTAPTL
jgi:TPR repeat protein